MNSIERKIIRNGINELLKSPNVWVSIEPRLGTQATTGRINIIIDNAQISVIDKLTRNALMDRRNYPAINVEAK